ncbi:MAG TPA: carboxyltransferase domain-containing protein, partial [Thermoanaerobaculia bacterium]|nr:carboxyltransferase domain-containing protein [Thermoanaerobaculia bacterium]
MQVRPAGDRAILVDLGDVSAEELHSAARSWRERGIVIVGHASLLVFPLAPLAGRGARGEGPTHHEIPVVFDRDPRDITLHARYLGFRAGFAYLERWPSPMPRLTTSRPVARGSFAVAGTMAGFYPIDTPGGWNILGRTNAVLWDPNREQPNLIAAGDVVHVLPVSELPVAEPVAPAAIDGEVIADVISPGQLTRIVGARDWSRVEHGLSPGGPFDEYAAAIANRAAGNADDAACLECVLVGPRLKFVRPTRIGLSDGRSQVVDEIDLGRLRALREYVAIEGGLALPRFAEEAVRVTRGMQL